MDKIVAGAALAFGVIGLIGLVGTESMRGGNVNLALAHKPQFVGEAARAAFAGFSGDLGKVSFLGLGLVLLAWFTRRGKFPVALASVVVLALLLVELWPVSRSVMQPTIGDPVARNLDTGRDDVIDWLQPDWLFDVGANRFEWRCLRRRPSIKLEVFEADVSAWQLFRGHHYLSAEIHKAAKCFVAT